MPENNYCIPVVAHLLFGRESVVRVWDGQRGQQVSSAKTLGGQVPWATAQLQPLVTSKLDRSQGTQRPLKEVLALFKATGAGAYLEGTVNDFWMDSGIKFELVATIDHSISSATANFLPRDVSLFNELASRFNVPRALNVFFVRDLQGAWGLAYPGHPDEPSAALGYAFVSDRYEMNEVFSPEQRWRADLITTAHELGHSLGLGHRRDDGNLMYGFGTRDYSTELLASQARMAQHRARTYRRAIYTEATVPHFVEPTSGEGLLFF